MATAMEPFISIDKNRLNAHTAIEEKARRAERWNDEHQGTVRLDLLRQRTHEAHEPVLEQAHTVRLNSSQEV
jgi:hypothetical protein